MVEHISYHLDDEFLSSLQEKLRPNYQPVVMRESNFILCLNDLNEIVVKDLSSLEVSKSFPTGSTTSAKRLRVWEQDGKSLIVVMSSESMRMLDLNGKLLKTLSGHKSRINCMCITPSGQFEDAVVVSGCKDCSILVHSMKTGKVLLTLEGHLKPVMAVALSIGPQDIELVVSIDTAGQIKLWNLETGELMRTL